MSGRIVRGDRTVCAFRDDATRVHENCTNRNFTVDLCNLGQLQRPAHETHIRGYLIHSVARMSASRRLWRPCSSKLPGPSQASNALRMAGHSSEMIEYHAVSRLRPL